MKPIPVGVQLYSVREQAAQDLPGVLREVRAMGYDAVEFAGYYGHSPQTLLAMLHDAGLQCCGTHTYLHQLTEDLIASTIELHKSIGAPYLIVPSMPAEWHANPASIAQTAARFDALAAQLRPHGIQIGYHAHKEDFLPMNGRSAWEALFRCASPEVLMQMDLGNAIDGGADPLAMLKLFPGRSQTIHLKEHPITAAIGEGSVPWQEVVEFCRSAGATKWFVVEYSAPTCHPLEGIRRCREALRRMGV